MTAENLVTATGTVTLEEAEKILMAKKVEKLLLVDENYKLTGLITIKDIDMMKRFPNACKDRQGRLRVGAAVGVFDFERAESLIDKGVDVLVVDSAHGHSANVIETVKEIKKRWDIDVVAGNVATREGCRDLIAAGADAVKVGIGPGSICTTRVISRRGRAADHGDYAKPPRRRGQRTRRSSPTAAFATRATSPRPSPPVRHCVMIGGLVRRPGRKPRRADPVPGPNVQGVPRHGLAGGDGERLQRTLPPNGAEDGRGPDKLVPEGVEGRVPFKGPLSDFVYQLVGGLRAGMGYCGTQNIEELRTEARFIQVSAASVRESHPHDIAITQEAPNYTAEYKSGTGTRVQGKVRSTKYEVRRVNVVSCESTTRSFVSPKSQVPSPRSLLAACFFAVIVAAPTWTDAADRGAKLAWRPVRPSQERADGAGECDARLRERQL